MIAVLQQLEPDAAAWWKPVLGDVVLLLLPLAVALLIWRLS